MSTSFVSEQTTKAIHLAGQTHEKNVSTRGTPSPCPLPQGAREQPRRQQDLILAFMRLSRSFWRSA